MGMKECVCVREKDVYEPEHVEVSKLFIRDLHRIPNKKYQAWH